MKKQDIIKAKILANKEVCTKMAKISYYDVDRFIDDCQKYIAAIKSGRMLCIIGSVSSSGMSRTIKFSSCEKGKERSWYRNYNCLFLSLGYTEAIKGWGYYRISGCGMDMVFHTNYSIIHRLHNLGFITKKECESYAQMTPVVL